MIDKPNYIVYDTNHGQEGLLLSSLDRYNEKIRLINKLTSLKSGEVVIVRASSADIIADASAYFNLQETILIKPLDGNKYEVSRLMDSVEA